MLFGLLIIADSNSQYPSGISIFLSEFAFETKTIVFLFYLPDCFLRRTIDLQFQNDSVCFTMFRIKDEINKPFASLIFTLYTITVACGQIDKIDYCGQLCFSVIRKNGRFCIMGKCQNLSHCFCVTG